MLGKKNFILVIIVMVLIVVAGVGFWFWSKNKQAPSASPSPTKEALAPTLGGTIFEKTQNPLKGQVPDTNPFKKQANPFDAVYQNPFK